MSTAFDTRPHILRQHRLSSILPICIIIFARLPVERRTSLANILSGWFRVRVLGHMEGHLDGRDSLTSFLSFLSLVLCQNAWA